MKKIGFYIVLLIATVFLIQSCDDIPDNVGYITTPAEVQNKMVDCKWYIVEYKFTDGIKDLIQYKELSDCEKQSYISFSKNKNFQDADYIVFDACNNTTTQYKYGLNYSGAALKLNKVEWGITFSENLQYMYLVKGGSSSRFAKTETKTYIRK